MVVGRYLLVKEGLKARIKLNLLVAKGAFILPILISGMLILTRSLAIIKSVALPSMEHSRNCHGEVYMANLEKARKWSAVIVLSCIVWTTQGDDVLADGGGRGTRVEIFDHGLQVPINQLTLPPGWKVNHNIATDVNDVWRYFSSYVIDFLGPYGEVSTALMPRAVYPGMGENWEQVWMQLFHERVGQYGDFQFGPTMESPLAQVLFPKSFAFGIPVFERSLVGTFRGTQVDGKLFTILGQTRMNIILYPSALLAPQGRLPATIDAVAKIAASQVDDPRYAQASQRIIAARMQRHQSVMQSNRNWFASHMASMREASRMQSQSNQQFSASLANTYTTDDQFTDYLRSTTSFMDPWSGQRVPTRPMPRTS